MSPMWIDGAPVLAARKTTFPVENRATAQVIEDVLRAGAMDVDLTVSVASGAFEDVHLD